MIIVNIAGGLGNQMFQFAHGQTLAELTGGEVRYFVGDISTYDQARDFELELAFQLKLKRATYKDIASTIGYWRAPMKIRQLLAAQSSSFLRGANFLSEENHKTFLDVNRTCFYVHGYWQSQKYFVSTADKLREMFKFREKLEPYNVDLMRDIKSSPSIAIHIRRGDYVSNAQTNKVHGVLSSEYYLLAIEYLRQLAPTARVFAFSDDPDWVDKAILSKVDNAKLVKHNYANCSFRDMQLMASCDHIVIANSTFSWWAAWLNNNPEKVVVAPKKWFANSKKDCEDRVPQSWRRI